MPQTTDSPETKRISAAGWRIVLLASLGGTLEFYDFVIFGIFAKDIADAIFPNPTPLVSLMVSFAAFAAGYLARPIGGIVLSHLGDRFGRRRVFLKGSRSTSASSAEVHGSPMSCIGRWRPSSSGEPPSKAIPCWTVAGWR